MYSMKNICCCLVFALTIYSANASGTINKTHTSEATEGDAALVTVDTQTHLTKNAVSSNARLWHNGKVPYYINKKLAAGTQTKIRSAMASIEGSVNSATPGAAKCIEFVERSTEYNYIEIYAGIGCHSTIGMENRGRQSVSIGPGCEFRGIIIHELLHALGFYHEHTRFDRDSYVTVNLTNVKTEDAINFKKMGPSEVSLQNTPYDLGSIMSYDPYTLAVDSSTPVLTPLDGVTVDVFQMGQRMSMSITDAQRVQRLYGCTDNPGHVVRPEETNRIMACNFAVDSCGIEDSGGDFSWQRHTGAGGSIGPRAGHSTGKDPYFLAKAASHYGKTARATTPFSSMGGPCIDFYLFIGDSTSTFSLEASGPDFMTTPLPFVASAQAYSRWTRYQVKMSFPPGFDFQITFKAKMGNSDVALDDLQMYMGGCN